MRTPGHSAWGALFVGSAIGLLLTPAVMAFVRHSSRRTERDAIDARVDRNLKDTFPASDPPAPHFVDIPVNRQ